MKYPKMLEIQTTTACNSGCIICPHHTVYGNSSEFMAWSLYQKILDECYELQRVAVYFNNEPLLDPTIRDKIAYVNETKPETEVELSSNVQLLSPNKQHELVGTRIAELRLSFFGFTPATHKRIMPRLSWDVCKSNLDYLVNNESFRKGIDRIGITMIDVPYLDKDDVYLAQSYCSDHGLEFNFWGFFDRSRNVNVLSNNIYKASIHGCEQERANERLHVLYDGTVVLCCMDWRSSVVLGNLQKMSVGDLWNSETYEIIRKRVEGVSGHLPPEICKKCKLAK